MNSMNSKSLLTTLENLNYPGLSRTLGELKLLGTVKVINETANIELLTVSDDSFLSVKAELEKQFSEKFSTLNITKKDFSQKQNAKQDTNY